MTIYFVSLITIALYLIYTLCWYHHTVSGHILLSLSAIAALSFASLQSIALYIKSRLLKKNASLAFQLQLPSMERLESELFKSLKLSFGFITATLITGITLSPTLFSKTVLPKSLAAVGAWGLLGSLLIGHHWFGWRGLKAVCLTLTGLSILLLGYFLSKMVFTW